MEENTNSDVVEEFECRNLNIGFVTKCEVQGPMGPKVLPRCEIHSHEWGECKG